MSIRYEKRAHHIAVLAGSLILTAFITPIFAVSPEQPETQQQVLTNEQQAELLKAGKKLAQDRCAACHSIKSEGDSTNKDAPPFRTFSSKYPIDSLEETLAEGIVTGHKEMPEYVFTPGEITAFLEFLASLQKK